MKSSESECQLPEVSTATGTKWCDSKMGAYLISLLRAALSAAVPALFDVRWSYDAANVSGTVTSHVKQRPLDQGIMVTPSGLFPSDLERPLGSLMAGILALETPARSRH